LWLGEKKRYEKKGAGSLKLRRKYKASTQDVYSSTFIACLKTSVVFCEKNDKIQITNHKKQNINNKSEKSKLNSVLFVAW
jgi:hypothetical protein